MPGRKDSRRKTGRVLSREERTAERAEETALEALVFGVPAVAASSDRDAIGHRESSAARARADARPGKRPRAVAAWEDEDDADVEVSLAGTNRLRKLREDEDDDIVDGEEYQKRLRSRLAGGKGAPEWAALPEDRAEEEDEADWSEEEDEGGSGYAEPAAPSASASAATSARRRIERSTAPVALESGALAPGRLSIRRVKDANAKEPARGVVTSVQFHPTGALVMVGSLDKTLRFFEADGQRNRKLASVHFPDMPVMDARLGGDGLTAFAVGRRPHYYTYDIPSATPTRIPALQGRGDRSLESFAVSPVAGAPVLAFLVGDGDVVLASTATRQPVGVMRASSAARAAAFTPDGASLLTACDDGLVHVWDVRTQRLRGRFEDEGMQTASSLAVSPGGDTIAVGSDAGIVNIYGTADVEAAMAGFADGPRGRPGAPSGPFRRAVTVAPRKVLTQITTRISGVTFNHDGSILAMASHTVADRLRLVHTGTMTAFGNWPTARTPLGYVRAAAFSPTGDRLAVGNDKGRVLLLRMPFFDDK